MTTYLIAAVMRDAEWWCRERGLNPHGRELVILLPSNGARALLGCSIGPDDEVVNIVRPDAMAMRDWARYDGIMSQIERAKMRGGTA